MCYIIIIIRRIIKTEQPWSFFVPKLYHNNTQSYYIKENNTQFTAIGLFESFH